MSSGPVNLSGRVAIVTGATSGIGREVALGLARLGATTVVVGRGADRASRAAAEIAQATGNPRVESLRVDDLAVISDTRALVAALLDRYSSVHILVNNAGAYFRRREVTPDGLERTFALNVLAPYILTNLLAPRLVASAPARVVNVASEAERSGRVDFDDLQFARKYAGFRAYGSSKLELLWLTREFARRLGGSGVTVNAVHPGYVRSGFGLNNGGGTAFVMRILGALFARSVPRGADVVLYAASAPELAAMTGGYYADRKPIPGTEDSRDNAKAGRLFEACARLSGLPSTVGESRPADSRP
jgi:NAD(P)-dependent dehydrogenase (short-subunit alcohol dehydrogenase family)